MFPQQSDQLVFYQISRIQATEMQLDVRCPGKVYEMGGGESGQVTSAPRTPSSSDKWRRHPCPSKTLKHPTEFANFDRHCELDQILPLQGALQGSTRMLRPPLVHCPQRTKYRVLWPRFQVPESGHSGGKIDRRWPGIQAFQRVEIPGYVSFSAIFVCAHAPGSTRTTPSAPTVILAVGES